MVLQRWEAKMRRKEKSPQPGIELTTTRSGVQHAHHWASRVKALAADKYSVAKMMEFVHERVENIAV